MNPRPSSDRSGAIKLWLFSFAFWMNLGVLSAALMVAQKASEGHGGALAWSPFHDLRTCFTYLPYVPGTVWAWRPARQLVEQPQQRRGWLHALAVVVTMGLVAVIWQRWLHGGDAWFGVLVGVFVWSALHFLAIVGIGAAVQGSRLAGERQRALLSAQLRALRAQLQPHFLFNTLHAIGVTAKQDGATAARMTTLLGDLLRQTLRERDGELVSLAEERELLQPYLQLQQLRFGDRLRVELDLPDDVLAAAVPDLILQPLVENALRHGIEQLPGAGHVVVRARRVADALELQVADDGVGPATAARDGIGLGGTRARLQAIYGDAADVQLAPGGVRGTVATLRVPFREVAHAA